MIVSKEAFFKRADANEQYEGFKAGIILIRDNQIVEVEGCFFNEKTDTLVGGWCEVYRSDRKFPIIAKVNLSEYDKKQSIWNEKKSTMISKIAKVQALREAFPAQLGAMYTQEESVTVQDAEYEEIKSKDKLAELAEKAAGVKEPKVTAPTEQPQTNTSKQPQQKTLL